MGQASSRAEQAGIRTGDVLVRAAARELRSVASLYAALDEHAGAGTMTTVRGMHVEFEAVVDVHRRPAHELAPADVTTPDDAGLHMV